MPAMKAALLFLLCLAGGIFDLAAQVPQGTQLSQHPQMPFYRYTPEGKKLDFVITGDSVTNLNTRAVLVTQFELKSFHDGDPKQVQITAQAPQCAVDISSSTASDSGPLKIFTPTTNLYVQGVGFLFTQSNHFLIVSNNVETRVVKSLLKSSMISAPKTNAADTNQIVLIYADNGRFNLDSNIFDYAGRVHMIDPQLDMTCDFVTIRLTTNGAVQSILARQNVILTTTNNGRATGDIGYYYVANGVEMMDLTNNATWRNGDEQAKANGFTYDSTHHLLHACEHVHALWPNANANAAPGSHTVGTNGFRELFSDFASLQFPPTNGPVERMTAHGNVIIINQADQSSATADSAVYERATDSFDLDGNPAWWTPNMRVEAQRLSAELGAKTYHAHTNAHFKTRTGGATGNSKNQWLFISSDDIDYWTNKAVFSQNVHTRLEQNGQLRDTLDCDLLTVGLTNNQVENGSAFGDVHGETAPDAAGLIKTIVCGQLNAWRSVKTGLMTSIDAHTNVVLQQKGAKPGAPCNQLSADTVTAFFSPVTNQIDHAVADQNVVVDQFKAGKDTHATAEHAVYTATNDEARLTGSPQAHTDSYKISNADFMIWQVKSQKFQAFGLYKILPIKTNTVTKSP
jgi:lipopolysaccharide export system protein LptA